MNYPILKAVNPAWLAKKWYAKVYKEYIDEVKKRHLLLTWSKSDIETQIRGIAHAIRHKKDSRVKMCPKYQYRLNLTPYTPQGVS